MIRSLASGRVFRPSSVCVWFCNLREERLLDLVTRTRPAPRPHWILEYDTELFVFPCRERQRREGELIPYTRGIDLEVKGQGWVCGGCCRGVASWNRDCLFEMTTMIMMSMCRYDTVRYGVVNKLPVIILSRKKDLFSVELELQQTQQ